MRESTDRSESVAPAESSKSPFADAIFEQGQIVGGKYKIISLLGAGGMGRVYRVLQVFLNKDFALKTIDIRKHSEISARRFQLEAKATCNLDHPNLVQVHDFGLLDSGQPYLVMDFIDGTSLSQHLLEHGPVPVDEAIPLFAQACFGLSYAHDKGIVHRDIKPGNIMLVNGVARDTEGSVKVVDFGIAKLTSHEDGEIQALTRTGEIFGSPLYMSPEQCSGTEIDRRSDIYSLGCVLFEALTGAPPHIGNTALQTMMLHQSGQALPLKQASLGKDFPERLEQIISKMLRKLPSERYQNLGIVAHELAFCTNATTGNRSSGQSRPKIPKPLKLVSMAADRFYMLLATTVLVAATLSGLGVYSFMQQQTSLPHNAVPANDAPVDAKKPSESNPSNGHQADFMDRDLIEGLSENPAKVAAEARTLANADPISWSVVTLNGVKKKRLVFPSCGIGQIGQIGSRFDYKLIGIAKGVVHVPIDSQLVLIVEGKDYPATLLTPSIFTKIDRNEFAGLILKNNNFRLDAAKSDKTRSTWILSILKTVALWPKLKSLHLDYASLNRTGLETLETMPALRDLSLTACTIDVAVLPPQPILRKLQSLCLNGTAGAASIVERMVGSPNLHMLFLRNASVSPAVLERLSQCKHLALLQLTESTIDDSLVRALSNLKDLKALSFPGVSLTRSQLATLSKNPKLFRIFLSQDKFPNAQELHTQYPKLVFSNKD